MLRSRGARSLCVLAIAGAATFAGIAPAGAGGSWVAAPLSNVNDAPTAVAVSGAGCVGSNALVILSAGANTNTLPGVVNVQLAPDGSGNWNGILNVPAGLAPGQYTLWGQCVGQFNYPNFAFTVSAPSVPSAPAAADPIVAAATLTG